MIAISRGLNLAVMEDCNPVTDLCANRSVLLSTAPDCVERELPTRESRSITEIQCGTLIMYQKAKPREDSMATPPLDVVPQDIQFSPPQVAFPWVIFDMDGTLVDSLRLIVESFNHASHEFVKKPLSIEEAQCIPIGSLEEQLANYVPRDFVPEAVERYHDYYVQHFDDKDIVYPGIRTLLTTLHEGGVKLAVYTGADKQSAHHTLSRSRLSCFFESVVTGNDVIRPKPDPEGLAITMKAIEAYPAQTVYLGDHPNDVKASRATGIKSAAACWGSKHLSELKSLNPEFCFSRPCDAIGQFLRQLNDLD